MNKKISFPAMAPKNSVQLSATASSGLPIIYSIVSGPGIIRGNTLSFTGEGNVVVRANQPGNENYLPGDPVDQTMLIFAEDEKKGCITLKVLSEPDTAG